MKQTGELTVTAIRFEGFASFERAFITLSNSSEEPLNAESLFYEGKNLYCKLQGKSIRFELAPALEILDRLKETNGEYSVYVCGTTINLKPAE